MCTLRGKSACLMKSYQAQEDFLSNQSISSVVLSSQTLICTVACGCSLGLCPRMHVPMPTGRVALGGSAFKPHQCSPAGWAAVLLLTGFYRMLVFYRFVNRLAGNHGTIQQNPVVLSVHFVSKAKRALKVEYSMLENNFSSFESSFCWMLGGILFGRWRFWEFMFVSFKLLLRAFRSREGCMLQHIIVLNIIQLFCCSDGYN